MTDRYKDKIQRYTEYALIGIIALELLFYIYTNLFRLSDVIDVDFARVLRHMTEMGDKRTIFLPHWSYITTAELDHSVLFALPIYILTGNMMVSYGIANIINIAIWCVVLYGILELTGLNRRCSLLAAALVLSLYDFGMLAYSNMLFIGAEHYTHKVLIPLMFILLILIPVKKRRSVGSVSLCLLYFGLLFITAISSGIYVFICGILPVIIYLIFNFIIRGKSGTLPYQALMSACSVIVTLMGIIVCKINHVTPNSELALYKSMETVRDNLFSTFLDLVEMFRVFPEKSVPVMSLSSMMSIVRLFIFIVILIFGLRSVGKLTATDSFSAPKSPSAPGEHPGTGAAVLTEQLLISVFLWNYFILFVSGSQQRYHILGAVPLMICAVMEFGRFTDGVGTDDKAAGSDTSAGDGIRILLYVLIVGAVLLLNLYQIFWGSRQYFHREDYSKAVDEAVISFMEEYDAGSAFSLYESGYGTEWLRAADKTRSYETYLPDTHEIINHDFYYSDRDRAGFTPRNVIIATEYEFDSCPEYIRDNYTLSGEALNYGLYLSEQNPIDGISGPIEGMDTVDLATSPGYEVKGTIDGAGHLKADVTGDVLLSPDLDITTPCTWTMDYEAEPGTEATVEIISGGEVIDKIALTPDDTQVSYVFAGGGSYSLTVKKSGAGMLYIGDMKFMQQ